MASILGIEDSGLSELGEDETIIGTLQNFGNNIQTELRESLIDKGMQVPDSLGSSIVFDIQEDTGSVIFELKMEKYGDFLDEGVAGVGARGIKSKTHKQYSPFATTGKFSFKENNKPSYKHFTNWVNDKGLPSNAVFAVRESVFRRGIKQTNWYTETIVGKVEELKDRLAKAGAKEIKVSFKDGKLTGITK